MTAPLGIAVVGLGLAGGAMVPVIRSHPGVRLAAAVDPVAELRTAFTQTEGLPAVADLRELWELDGVDAVYLATPHRLHREQAVEAARAGRHVVVEKPMALDPRDADEMLAAADAAGVTLVVGHTHGFDPAVRWIARAVAEQRHGSLGMITAINYTDFLYRPRLPVELDESQGGGIWFNQLAHQVDVVRTIAPGPVRSVKALSTRLDPTRGADGSTAVLLEIGDGVVVSLVYSGYDHFDSDELYGWVGEGGHAKSADHGAARRAVDGRSRDQEQDERRRRFAYGHRTVRRPEQHPHFGELVVTCSAADLRPTPGGVQVYGRDGSTAVEVPLGTWAGRGDVLDELVGAVRRGEPAVHDGRFGRATVAVCAAVLESVRCGSEIRLDLEESHA